MPDTVQSSVAILMGTKDGARFLDEQLQSFAAQTHTKWQMWVSDDYSTDGTREILKAFQDRHGAHRVFILDGPGKGFSANFMSLLCNPLIAADYYAYSDQDDIWEKDKLERALTRMKQEGDTAVLYGTRTRLVDAKNREFGFSPLWTKPPAFRNALIQSIAGANTMVINQKARDILTAAGPLTVVGHDWWSYLAISACGGRVIYDPWPSLRYRQHDANLIGSNKSLAARLLRAKLLMGGRLKGWNDMNTAALQSLRPLMPPENRRILDEFCAARQKPLIPRLRGMRRTGIYRQTLLGNLGIWTAAVVNRL